jgi:hypothetical protein
MFGRADLSRTPRSGSPERVTRQIICFQKLSGCPLRGCSAKSLTYIRRFDYNTPREQITFVPLRVLCGK